MFVPGFLFSDFVVCRQFDGAKLIKIAEYQKTTIDHRISKS